MKSEHRHELQTNDLSKLTSKGVAFVEKNVMPITIAICVAAVAIAGYRIYTTQSSSARATAWFEFSNARTPDDFAALADNELVKGTAAADWAVLMAAEGRLSQSIQGMFTDRANALTELTAARDDFEKLVGNKDPMIKQRAIFGMARAEESLGNLEKARAAYSELAGDAFKSSVYHKQSQERAEYLAKSGPQAFYAWFQKQNPKPPEPPKPDGGTGNSDIFDPGSLPFGGGDSLPFGSGPAGQDNSLKGLPNLDDSDNEGPGDTDTKPDAAADDATEAPEVKPEAADADPPAEPSEPATEAVTDGAADNTDDAK